MGVFVCGDFHGSMDIRKVNTKNWPEGKELTKEDYLIQLGDFGLLWKAEPDDEERYWMSWLDNKPWTTLVIPGNHENYERIEELPLTEINGAKARKYSDSIYFIERGEILTIEGKTIFCFGGATSIDKQYRQFKISWWPQEVHSYANGQNALDNLNKYDFDVDHVVSHTCPSNILKPIFTDIIPCPVGLFFDEIVTELSGQNLQFKEWHFGHFHEDKVFTEKYYCHYENPPTRIF